MSQDQQPQEKKYPLPTTDGFVFQDEDDEVMGIETQTHANGNLTKRIRLSSGSIAMVRELKGHDVVKSDRLHGGDESKYMPAIMALATKINGEAVVMEAILDLKAKDYNRIRTANASLNF